MHKKRTSLLIGIMLMLALILPTWVHFSTHKAHASGTNYYVDHINGNDSNPGTEQQPWQTIGRVNHEPRAYPNSCPYSPGDAILLQEGDTWTDNAAPETSFLNPQGSGVGTSTQGPITINEYCNQCPNSNKPTINGNGDNATIELYNQQWWDISNLIITDTPSSCPPSDLEQDPLPSNCQNSSTPRRGIYVYVNNPGPNPAVFQHIYVSDVTVQDVDGPTQRITDPNSKLAKTTGGIVYYIDSTSASDATFDDIQVTGTTVHDVYYEGIILTSDYLGPPAQNQSCFSGWNNYQPSTNEQIENNYVYSVGGNGITVHVSSGALISSNIVRNGGKEGNGLAEGIASLDNLNAVIEKNQVYNMKFNGTLGGYPDTVAFDVDDCDNGTKVEYNYSHDNQGGFMTIEPYAINAIVRYNVSERDGYGDKNQEQSGNGIGAILKLAHKSVLGDAGQNWQVYNNTFYIADPQQNSGPGTQLLNKALPAFTPPAPLFENNLVENLQNGSNDTSASCSAHEFLPQEFQQSGTDWTVDYNDFYSTITGGCPDKPSQSHDIINDGYPGFQNPGAGFDGDSGDANDDWQADAAFAYALTGNANIYCTGTILEAPSDDNVDFNGISIPKSPNAHHVDPGALEHSSSCS